MKIKTTLAALGLAAVLSGSSFAAGVGVVNLKELVKSSPYSLRLQKSLNDRFNSRKESLDALKQSMMAEFQKLNKNKAVMKNKDKKALQEKLQQQQQNYITKMKSLQHDYMMAEKKSSDDFINKVKTLIKQDALNKKLTLVLPKEAVFYANKEVDLTSDILKKLS